MRASFRIGAPALGALLVNGVLLGALLTLGMGQRAPRKERATLTVMDLAVLQGAEDGADEAEAADPPAAANAAKPAPNVPAPAVVQPPVLAPTAIPAPTTIPATATPLSSTSSPASPTVQATAPAIAAPKASAAPASAPVRRGARDGLDANAPAGTSRSYAAKVRSWLLAHKTYPKHARMRREEGVVRVFFVIDRAGRLIEGRVLAACGRAALDDEAAAMLRRASPYPPSPSDLPGERFEITAPVDFVLPG